MVQLQFLNKILKTKDISIIKLNNLDVSYFSEYKNEFDFINNHIQKYNKIPDIETFLAKFPKFEVISVNEPDSYLIKELVDDRNSRFMAENFNRVRELILNGDTDNAMSIYKKGVDNLKTGITLESVDILHDTSRYDTYLEKTKDFSKFYVKTGFPELDKIIGGWDRSEELATIVARTNVGKCLAKGTKVLMADGTIKAVEDVKIGDEVQSFNRINTVLALHNGVSKGYKIIPNKGEPFVVSENHILTISDGNYNLTDIMIENFLSKSEEYKKSRFLFRPVVNYNNPINKLTLEPDALGYLVLMNKCDEIPLKYITASKEQRSVLIHSLSHFVDNKYVITNISNKIMSQALQIIRGLGWSYDVVYKNGSLAEIDYIECNDAVGELTTFEIEPVERVEYYGFMCDGDSRYLLADNTLTHNTWVLLKTALASAEQGLNVGIYSGEMTAEKVGYRIDTLISHISNKSLTHGSIAVQNEYKEYIDSLGNRIKGTIRVLTPTMIDGPAGVSALGLFIEKEKLDILFVDQHSLLEDDKKAKNPVERASNISKDLKNLQVMKKIPIISVSQQNRVKNEDVKGGTSVDTAQIAQSDRIGQDSTCVLFLEKKDNLMKLTLVKSRDSENGKTLSYAVDVNTGVWTYVPAEDDAIGGQSDTDYSTRYDDYDDAQGGNIF